MEPENENIEIKVVEEKAPAAYRIGAGGEASVTLRLLNQEEFDRLEREKAGRE